MAPPQITKSFLGLSKSSATNFSYKIITQIQIKPYNITMIFYTKSEKANYTHIHAYAFYDLFLNQIETQNFQTTGFQINVDIDGNVATWTLNITDPGIQNLFQNLITHTSFTDHQISDAIAKICHKNNLRAHLKNLNLLKSELNRIEFQTKKPEISDDSLISEAIDFIKPRP